MARIQLLIDDVPQHMTLKAMLEAAGHTLVESEPDAVFSDSVEKAKHASEHAPAIVLTTAASLPDTVRAMRDGVWGYVFVPLQPGEAELSVSRALAAPATPESDGSPDDMQTLNDIEMEYIRTVLRRCKHNQARAARILGIGRNTLWRKLKKARDANA